MPWTRESVNAVLKEINDIINEITSDQVLDSASNQASIKKLSEEQVSHFIADKIFLKLKLLHVLFFINFLCNCNCTQEPRSLENNV